MAIICPRCNTINFSTNSEAATSCRKCQGKLDPNMVQAGAMKIDRGETATNQVQPRYRINWIGAAIAACIIAMGCYFGFIGETPPSGWAKTTAVLEEYFRDTKVAVREKSGGMERITREGVDDRRGYYMVDGQRFSLTIGFNERFRNPGRYTIFYNPQNPAEHRWQKPLEFNHTAIGALIVAAFGLIGLFLCLGIGGHAFMIRESH
jgi:hypothetical protein